ncbi:hypothetical protein [Bradyrhizobium sp. USDA 372]
MIGRNGIDVTKEGGDYIFDLDYTDFPVIGAVPAGTTYALIYNPATGKYSQLPIALLGSVGEAPVDGNTYGRKDAGWTIIGAGGVTSVFGRTGAVVAANSDYTFAQIGSKPTTVAGYGITDALTDAPSDGVSYVRRSAAWVRSREVLTADRTYYVRTDGNNANNGLTNTAGGAFLTIQKAVDVVASLDLSIYQATIQVGPGTYAGGIVLTGCVGSKPPSLVGDTTTPANVVISHNNDVVACTGPTSYWRVGGFKITATSGHGLRCTTGAVLIFEKMEFGSFNASFSQLYAESYGAIQAGFAIFNYTITGGAAVHANAAYGGFIQLPYNTITLVGTPAFAAFATANNLGQLRADSVTFSGGATGKRYDANSLGLINGTGGNATYFPGSIAGTTATGGQYL